MSQGGFTSADVSFYGNEMIVHILMCDVRFIIGRRKVNEMKFTGETKEILWINQEVKSTFNQQSFLLPVCLHFRLANQLLFYLIPDV